MNITKVYIKNINSLKGDFIIDFTHDAFAQSPIFAITGDIGAGKSSILDAICLALYGKTPRVNSVSEAALNQGQIATIGTDDSYAKVEFENLGKKYRSSWLVGSKKRGENKGQWNAPNVDFEVWNPQLAVWKSDPNGSRRTAHAKLIEEAIGLSFDQFEKTILLAQGSFAELLKAKESERIEIIEKLTGTTEYRHIGIKVYATHKAKKIEIEKLTTEIKTKSEALLDDELKAELKAAVELYETQLQQKQEVISKLKNNIEKIEKHIQTKQKLAKTTTELQELLKGEEKINSLKNQLKRHEQAQEIQVYYERKKQSQNALLIEENKHKQHIEKLSLAKTEKVDFENQQLTVFPLIDRTTNMESSIIELCNELQKLDDEIKQIIQKGQNESAKLKTLKEQQKKANAEISNYQEQLKKQENILQIAHVFFDKNKLSPKQAKDISQQINALSKQEYELYNSFAIFCEKLSIEQALAYLQNTVQNDEYPDDLKTAFEAIHQKIIETKENYLSLETKWNNEIEQQKKLLEINVKISKLGKDINTGKELALSHQKTIEQNSQEAEQLKQALEKFKRDFSSLQNSDSKQVLELRAQLENDKPCSVCGSNTHPFSDANNELLVQFAQQKLLEIEQEKNIKNLEKSIAKSKEELSSTNARLEIYENNKKELQTELKNIIQKISLFEVELHDINAVIDLKNKALLSLKSVAEKHQAEEEKLKQIAKYRYAKQLQDINNQYNKFDSEVTNSTELNKADEQSLNQYQLDYSEKTQQRQHAESRKIEINIDIEKTQQNLKTLDFEVAEQEQIVEGLQEDYKNKKAELSCQFKSELSPSKYKEEFTKEYNTLQSNIKLKKAAVDEIEKTIKELKEKLNDQIIELNTQLAQQDFASEDEMLKQLLDKKQIQQLKDEIENYQNKLTSLQTTARELQKNLNEIGAVSYEEIESLASKKETFKQLEKDKETFSREQGGKAEQLRKDNELIDALNKLRELQKAKEIEFLPFDLLNKAIGSADGDKFAKVASRFTFNQLLEFTNYHLNNLKSRYTFKPLDVISDDKDQDLMVFDLQMGMAIRPAKSTLSGGETFLTSLCLALALSDLSSSKVQIKSLFIDEGFGSLDQNSLHDAISLLENLPDATGKTIGIISHVEGLKQRIGTQIQLKKQGNGYSKMILPNN